MTKRRVTRLLLLLGWSVLLLVQCGKQPASPQGGPSIALTLMFGPSGAPRIGKTPQGAPASAQPLYRKMAQEKVDLVRVMVLDFSAYDSSSQYFDSEDYENYVQTRDSWPGDFKYWGEWRRLLGNFFRVVADQALTIEGDSAKGTVTGVVGLNYLCVAMIEADTIRYWGEGEVMVHEGHPAHAAVQVWDTAPQLFFLEVRPHFVSLKNGLTQRFRCFAYYTNQAEVDVTTQATWFVIPGLAGSVDRTGLLTAALQTIGEESVYAAFAGDTSHATAMVTRAQLLLAEDFESYSVGAYPSQRGWQELAPGVSSTVSSLRAFSGSKSLRQESAPGHARRDLVPVQVGDSLTFQISILLEENDKGAVFGLYNRQVRPTGEFAMAIEFGEDGNIHLRYGTERFSTLGSYQPFVWYTVRCEVAMPSYVRLSLDGEDRGFLTAPSGVSWHAVVLAAKDFASGTSVQYYDDLRITTP